MNGRLTKKLRREARAEIMAIYQRSLAKKPKGLPKFVWKWMVKKLFV